MSEENGPIFVELTDDDGNEVILEYVTSLEIGGQEYRVFFPTFDEDEEPDNDVELDVIILKVIQENGEEILSTIDDEEELQRAYDQFCLELEEDEEE